ncbi:MAG TPA: HAMP domain-containing sensor histidine kinase [Chthoniobacterales bacterium]
MSRSREDAEQSNADDAFCGELAASLEGRRAAVLEQALGEVCRNPEVPRARELSGPQLCDHLPRLLNRLVAHLQGAPRVGTSVPARLEADAHGHERWEEHYQLHELVRELGVLERVVLREVLGPLVTGEKAARSRAAATARERVRQFFEDAVAASAERFVQDAGRARDDVERRLREADASRLALLGTVTHELRGYLQTLTWTLEAVGTEAPAADRQRMRDVCRRNLADMAALLAELTDYGGLLAGWVRPALETFAVADFAGELVGTFSPSAEASGVDLRVDADVGLEAVTSDRRRLRQVATNLILNALKYRRRDGKGAWIRVTFEGWSADRWRMAVEDNGVGIAPEDLGRIFEAFQRVAPPEDVQGTGLGLTITRRLVELLGGEVRVSSRPGEGSRFEVDLPRAFPETSQENPGALGRS